MTWQAAVALISNYLIRLWPNAYIGDLHATLRLVTHITSLCAPAFISRCVRNCEDSRSSPLASTAYRCTSTKRAQASRCSPARLVLGAPLPVRQAQRHASRATRVQGARGTSLGAHP